METIRFDLTQCAGLAQSYIVEHSEVKDKLVYCRPIYEWEEYNDLNGKLLGIEVGYKSNEDT